MPESTALGRDPYTCDKHGPFGPARFCCACTREGLIDPRDEAAVERVARRLYVFGHGYDIDASETARVGMLDLARELLRAAGEGETR